MHIVRSLNTQRINLVNESLYVKRQRKSGRVCIRFDGPVAGRKLISSLCCRQLHHHHHLRFDGALKGQNHLELELGPEPQGVAVVLPPHYQRTYGKIMQTKLNTTISYKPRVLQIYITVQCHTSPTS